MDKDSRFYVRTNSTLKLYAQTLAAMHNMSLSSYICLLISQAWINEVVNKHVI